MVTNEQAIKIAKTLPEWQSLIECCKREAREIITMLDEAVHDLDNPGIVIDTRDPYTGAYKQRPRRYFCDIQEQVSRVRAFVDAIALESFSRG